MSKGETQTRDCESSCGCPDSERRETCGTCGRSHELVPPNRTMVACLVEGAVRNRHFVHEPGRFCIDYVERIDSAERIIRELLETVECAQCPCWDSCRKDRSGSRCRFEQEIIGRACALGIKVPEWKNASSRQHKAIPGSMPKRNEPEENLRTMGLKAR
jgi:hypothetical protein